MTKEEKEYYNFCKKLALQNLNFPPFQVNEKNPVEWAKKWQL